ncbi:MAG: hypothetical protein PHI85_05670 [Victivallaceae bacterium]|nr:hypothetical protein [Victivallaceae bacterium]
MKKYVTTNQEFDKLVDMGFNEDFVLRCSPEIAASINEKYNRYNRKPSLDRVEKYARQIQEGHWLCERGADPLKMDKKHNVFSGGHRLAAIILANMTADLNVQLDLNPRLAEIQDDCKTRTTEQNNPALNKMITAISTYLTGMKLSTREETLLFEHYGERFREIFKMFPKHKRGITITPVYGEFFKAYPYISLMKLKRFANVLSTGYTSGLTGDQSLITLRNALQDGKGTSVDDFGAKVYWPRIQSILQNADRGRNVTKIVELKKPVFELEDDISKIISSNN